MTSTAFSPPPRLLARRARLQYTSDEEQGIQRITRGRTLHYVNGNGRSLRDPQQLQRIRALGIPPAWTDVWICANARGHLQATGRDARRRKQYIYHPDWQAWASRTKFNKLLAFGEALAGLRKRVAGDLALPGLSRTKVVAAVIALLDETLVRVGNEEYARANGSYGLTTLRNRHAKVQGPVIHLNFQGKSGKLRQIDFSDRRLARIVRACQELPGQLLFQYADDEGQLRRVESADVNRYLRAATGRPFTAKDFRTWKATAMALAKLYEHDANPQEANSATAARRAVTQALREAAAALGNTVTVCRKYYVHPQLIDLFMSGKLRGACGRAPARARSRLQPQERLLLRLLRRLAHPARR